ncbi:hypothetical protein BK816_08405 [Boudabousia tangfeifanii]|uniref:exo-alpha-sialidase n=1 Tax=Boudabousia tangfeifanii TaxID=1912795 RepID=A0A1D9MLY6_9ACTO|nr:sialidase family protein [Boudabousia tangfeifanii]AOZ73295.1 hypothetical protein BK816_08405 [Boudabousia tangfeifanii]
MKLPNTASEVSVCFNFRATTEGELLTACPIDKGTEPVTAQSEDTENKPVTAQLETEIDQPVTAQPSSRSPRPNEATPGWILSISGKTLYLLGQTALAPVRLDMEDTANVCDGAWHSLMVTSSAESGSKIFLDGYQCFSATADLSPAGLTPKTHSEQLTDNSKPGSTAHTVSTVQAFANGTDILFTLADREGLETTEFEVLPEALSPQAIRARALEPTPLIEFAANRLSDYDTRQVAKLSEGTIFTRFRVRGPGQYGTIMAGAAQTAEGDLGPENLRLKILPHGIIFEVLTEAGQWREFTADGWWGEGNWHDVVVRVARGAIDLFIDGYLEAHLPGRAFFADLPGGLGLLTIGQDTRGQRLFGEVRNAAIHPTPLNEWQIKGLSGHEPLDTQCLFDYGYHQCVSYRIPSLLTTQNGVVLAGADQRETIPNDAPNKVNFVLRRSLDSGRTWQPMQTIVTWPGEGATGASATDSCLLQDRQTGRIFALLDHFPGAIGQPNADPGLGLTEDGKPLLFDRAGQQYVWHPDGTVTTGDGQPTNYHVDVDGNVTVTETDPRAGQNLKPENAGAGRDSNQPEAQPASRPGGNVYLALGEDPHETLHTARTCYLQVVFSDDDGATWSTPQHLNHLVKQEWMPFLGAAPGNGIQIRGGKFAGRLVAPVYLNSIEHRDVFSAAVVYSDDHGQTWQLGASMNDGRNFEGETLCARTAADPRAGAYECTVVERENGELLLLMRNQHPAGKVLAATSTDGGESWENPYFVPEIPEVFCQPNAINAPTEAHPWRLIFANASQLLPYRGRGVLRLSEDGGRTWIASRTFNPQHYVYQCLCVLPDGNLGLLWERETQGLYFTRIPQDWLENAKNHLPQ